jgi:hypothetical protein
MVTISVFLRADITIYAIMMSTGVISAIGVHYKDDRSRFADSAYRIIEHKYTNYIDVKHHARKVPTTLRYPWPVVFVVL